jgi:hypothetical protein
MAQSEEIAEGAKYAWMLRVVPRNPDQTFTIVVRLCHPDMCDLPRSSNIGKNPRRSWVNCPCIRISPAGIPGGEATGLPVSDPREFIYHSIFPFVLPYETRRWRRQHVRSILWSQQNQIKTDQQNASQFCTNDSLWAVRMPGSGHGVVVGIGVVSSSHPIPS